MLKVITPRKLFSFMITLFLLLIFWNRIVYVIPPGSSGVLWLAFFGGTVQNFSFKEGIKIIPPWDKIYIYDNRLKRLDITVVAAGSDGLSVEMKVSLSYSLNSERNASLHTDIGPEYENVLLVPELTAAITRVITNRQGKALYTEKRQEIENEIMGALKARFAAYPSPTTGKFVEFMSLDFFNIREINLPNKVVNAIEDKLAAEENVEMEKSVLQQKQLEAQSVKIFQEIVNPGITENLLRWQGIDATLKLSQSTNSKLVIIGNSRDGLPLILDSRQYDNVEGGKK